MNFFLWINFRRWIWIFVLKFSCDLTRLLFGQRVIPHHPAKCGDIDIIEEEILSFRFDTWPLVITWSDSCNFIISFASPCVSTLQKFVAISPLAEEIFDLWFDGWVYLTISHQFANFHSDRSCERGYVTIVICRVTTYHHFAKGSCESIGRFF